MPSAGSGTWWGEDKNRSTVTTLDQTRWFTAITYCLNAAACPTPMSLPLNSADCNRTLQVDTAAWFHQGGKGDVALWDEGGTVQIRCCASVFLLVIDHGAGHHHRRMPVRPDGRRNC